MGRAASIVSGIFWGHLVCSKKDKKVVEQADVCHGNHELPCRTAERPSDRHSHPIGHDHQRVEGRTEGVAGSVNKPFWGIVCRRKRKIRKSGFRRVWITVIYIFILDISLVRWCSMATDGNRAITLAPPDLQFFQGLLHQNKLFGFVWRYIINTWTILDENIRKLCAVENWLYFQWFLFFSKRIVFFWRGA